jgi:hypothetical protein
VFFENSTREAWMDAKALGGLDELEASKPKVSDNVWSLYSVYSQCRRDAEGMNRIKYDDFYAKASVLRYETDMAVSVLQAADDHYLKLCADKLKRMNQK